MRFSDSSHLNFIFECHKQAFPGSLSSKQGRRFCNKMFSWFIFNERGILMHIEEDNEVIGYCSGVITKKAGLPGPITSIIQYAFWDFLFSLLLKPWLLLHPELFYRRNIIFHNLGIRILKTKRNNSLDPDLQSKFRSHWGIVGICVRPDKQGQGYGSLLLNEFEKNARNDSVEEIQLSVKKANVIAIKAYIKNGWFIDRDHDTYFEMVKRLKY